MKKTILFIVIIAIIIGVGLIISKLMKNNNSSDAMSNQNITTQITIAEVAKHADASDCWLVLEGKVYNVTDFIPNHPGGERIIQGCGKDATDLFNGRGHSERARGLLPKYQIGVLAK